MSTGTAVLLKCSVGTSGSKCRTIGLQTPGHQDNCSQCNWAPELLGTRTIGHQDKWAPGQVGTKTNGHRTIRHWKIGHRTIGHYDKWALDNWAPGQMTKLLGFKIPYLKTAQKCSHTAVTQQFNNCEVWRCCCVSKTGFE